MTTLDSSALSFIPPVGGNVSSVVSSMAGGGPPASYNWAPSISDSGTATLQLLQFFESLVAALLVDGYGRLGGNNSGSGGGQWAHVYPPAIVSTVGSMAAQSLVHRSTATDSLQHYSKTVMSTCTLNLPAISAGVDVFLEAVVTLLHLEIGLLLDSSGQMAVSDSWMVPALATQVGAKSRMAAVVNMMQGHSPAAAPREAVVPAPLAYSYAFQKYVSSCPDSATLDKAFGKPLPALQVTNVATTITAADAAGRALSVTVALGSNTGSLFIAWIGAWGSLEFTSVSVPDGTAAVPTELSGHVWIVLVNKRDVKAHDLPGVTVAGPELVWVSGETLE